MVSAARHDETRAAAALLAIAARDQEAHRRRLCTAVLGADPDEDRIASVACILSWWLAAALRKTGSDPAEFAKHVIADSIGEEATEGAP